MIRLAIYRGQFMKRFVEGADRGQSILLPECLDEWVEESNSVRVVDSFVDALDLEPNRNGAVTSAVLGAPTRGTGPLRLALAGATRSGSAGVGSPSSRSAGEATPHSSGVNWNDN